MKLSKSNLKKITVPGVSFPDDTLFDLPEKVLQFGTGVLLRGLPDYFIDKANKTGVFNGRTVVVKSTDTGSVDDFDEQDCLYTLYIKGIQNGTEVSEQVISSAISRVLSAAKEWGAILEVAKSPQLQVVISNTTEVGIQLIPEDIAQQPPASFPGKLLAILYERYKAFAGSEGSGLVIIPTELIVDNGKKLRAIVLELAHLNNLEEPFINWLQHSNSFCNSLVDRIVPGKPPKELAEELENTQGYSDGLSIMAEPYSLWAIEGDSKIAELLSFSKADSDVLIIPDIELFRELKLRLLNGTHTLSCAFAFLSGFATVKEAMDDEGFVKFITQLAFDEIMPAIPYEIDHAVAVDFANKVLDRFRNPFIRHEWISISAQYSTKMRMRVVPLLINHFKLSQSIPENMCLGFAAYLRFMKVKLNADGKYTGSIDNKTYMVTDAQAEYFCRIWEGGDTDHAVQNILSNEDLWETDLTKLPGFKDAVTEQLKRFN